MANQGVTNCLLSSSLLLLLFCQVCRMTLYRCATSDRQFYVMLRNLWMNRINLVSRAHIKRKIECVCEIHDNSGRGWKGKRERERASHVILYNNDWSATSFDLFWMELWSQIPKFYLGRKVPVIDFESSIGWLCVSELDSIEAVPHDNESFSLEFATSNSKKLPNC